MMDLNFRFELTDVDTIRLLARLPVVPSPWSDLGKYETIDDAAAAAAEYVMLCWQRELKIAEDIALDPLMVLLEDEDPEAD